METPRQKLWISNTARSCCSRLDKYKWTRGSPAHSIVQVTQFFQVGLSQVADKEIILRCLHKVTIPASILVVSCRSSLVIPNSKWIAFCVHCCEQNCKMFTSKTFMFINKAISGSTCCAVQCGQWTFCKYPLGGAGISWTVYPYAIQVHNKMLLYN